jgi:hypothetical protein
MFLLFVNSNLQLCHTIQVKSSRCSFHSHLLTFLVISFFFFFFFILSQDTSFRQEIEQSPELGLLILDAMQEAEIDNNSERLKKRRRITETGGDNGSALVPRQVRERVA